MRAILSKVLIFGSLRGAFFMDVRESDRKTARASRTGKAEKPEEGCARADGESGDTERKQGDERTGKVDNGVRAGGEQQLRWITCRQH